MQKKYRILAINPGERVTKIGVFLNELCIYEKTIEHDWHELMEFNSITDQYVYRKQAVLEDLHYEGINLSKLHAVSGRGGLLRPVPGGTYEINSPILNDLKSGHYGEHPSNLGGLIAFEIAASLHIPSFLVDPVAVDEMEEVARFSGLPEIPRKSIFHALLHKAIARKAAKDMESAYEKTNLIVAQLGEGITIGAHKNGKVIDVNNGLDGDGPFTMERAGSVPAGGLVSLCYSGKYDRDEMVKKLYRQGGLSAYLQTNDINEVEKRIANGDRYAKKLFDAFVYQIAKEIGSMSAVLCGDVDGIILTGRHANRKHLVSAISKRVDWIADTLVYPEMDELEALAEGALRVLTKVEDVKMYPNELKSKGAGIL